MVPVTTIRPNDGVHFDSRQITRLKLRSMLLTDLPLLPAAHTLPGAIAMLAELSGEPVDALSTLTMDDTVIALEALGSHIGKNRSKVIMDGFAVILGTPANAEKGGL